MVTTAQNDSFQTTESGFSVTRQNDHSEFQEQDVKGFRVETRRQSDMVGTMTVQETLHLRVGDTQGDRWVSMTAEVGPLDRDPLAELRNRILDMLLERSCETLLKAGDVEGQAWSLSLIHFSDSKTGRTYPPQEISAVCWIGDELCLYHEDQSEPFASYDRTEENTILLASLLQHVVEDVKLPSETPTARGLGGLQKQVTASQRRWLTTRRAAMLAGVPIAAMIYALPLSVAAAGTVLLLLAYWVTIPLLSQTSATLRLYERAVVWTCGNQESVLLFDQVNSMTAAHVDVTQVDGTVAPQLELRYRCGDRPDQRINFCTMITPENRELLESIIIDSATILAGAMRSKLEEDGEIRWTDRLLIADDQIVYQETPSDPAHRMKRSDIQGWSLSDTRMMMALSNGNTISSPTSCDNFYPGLVLISDLGWFKSVQG